MQQITRELIITVNPSTGVFTVSTWMFAGMLGGGWHQIHSITVSSWPALAVARVAGRNDYRVRVQVRDWNDGADRAEQALGVQ